MLLLNELAQRPMRMPLVDHLCRDPGGVCSMGGVEVQTQADVFFLSFPDPPRAPATPFPSSRWRRSIRLAPRLRERSPELEKNS